MAPSDDSRTHILTRVRRSCAQLLAHKDAAVRVNDDKIRAFLDELDWQQYASLAEPLRFPLNFCSEVDEINFLTLYSLLNFGSGYRKDLHKYCDRLYGLLGMYISVPKLNSAYLQTISLDVVANFFNIPLEKDEEISTGIYIAKPGPLKPLAQMIQQVLNECGEKLAERNYEDFGAFVVANLRSDATKPPSAVYLVEQLTSVFPAFDDHREVRGEKCYFLKRAQLAVSSLQRRFKESNPEYTFHDFKELTALSDNVIPCVLKALGILEYDADLEQTINSGEFLPAGVHECEVRAGAIIACEKIIAASDGKVTVGDLDGYLWRVGKEPRFRGLERHATRDTFFY
uniref:Queuosine 5'-phosphate N-glycosylase/hydrolase n=1 Tax=Globisporangium ultimum (strain ATCC 200006 / CBS 805.95 / DAOM BR144) TaxID=431595 RepID=K3XBZ5_GLOUD